MKTLPQVLEMHGNALLKFYMYNKYVFWFKGKTNDGLRIEAVLGDGTAPNIYRLDIDYDSEYSLRQLAAGIAHLREVAVYPERGNPIFYHWIRVREPSPS